MRVIRYLLQAAIILFGGSVLTALVMSSRSSLLPALGFAAFFAFLFLLTLLLREQTEGRMGVGRDVDPRYIAVLLGSLGVGACWLAASVVKGYSGASTRRGSLLRVSIEVFGPWPAAMFFLATGLCLLALAYRILRRRRVDQ